MAKALVIKKGDQYGNFTAIEEVGQHGGRRFFKFRCICGNIKEIRLSSVINYQTKSCGCNTGKKIKHGMYGTRIYTIWGGIKSRCYNTKVTHYKDYGGRGINCAWNSFENFYEDMKEGYSDNLQIDRIDNNGDYCKENCRWITPKQNCRNRRNTLYFNSKPLIQWCEELGLDYCKVKDRYRKLGWTIEDALELTDKKGR